MTEPIRKSSLPTTPPPEWEFSTVLGAPHGCFLMPGDTGEVVVRRRVSYGDWEPVRPDRWADEPAAEGRDAARQTTGQTDTEPVVAYWDSLRPDNLYCREHGEARSGLTPRTSDDLPFGGICITCGRDVLIPFDQPDSTVADDPTPLRWGLGDVLHGDDGTVIVCLSGPAPDRAPYWLELDVERAATLRKDLTAPGDVPAAEQPAEAQATNAWQPAYDAVYARIRALGDYLPPDPAHRNTLIWRAVHAALNALIPPQTCVAHVQPESVEDQR